MEKFPSLNGLRAISISIVILFHLLTFNFNINAEILSYIPIFNGQFGVNVFFVISGFLITSLLLKEEENTGSISLRNFYTRRILRIFPAYFFLLFIYWILQTVGYLYIPKTVWLTALTYTKYLNYSVEWYTGHAWSLSIEENFYLLWPLVFMLGKQVRENVAILIIIVVPFIRLYAILYSIHWFTNLSPFTRIDAIAVGCYFALFRKELLQRMELHWKRLFYLCLIILFAWSWLLVLISKESVLKLIFVGLGTLNGTIANILIACIMMYSVFGPKGNWYKVLNSKGFNYVGALSYSLYLWQQLFIHYYRSKFVTHFPQNLLFILLTAMFSYYFIERPFLRFKAILSGKKTKALPISSPIV